MKTLMIDLDGVLASYDGIFRANRPGPPNPGALEAFTSYVKAGFEVVVFTSRATGAEGRFQVQDWLAMNGFHAAVYPQEITVTAFKKPAVVYLDDRAWRFSGTWPTAEELDGFKPWWEK